MEGVQRVRRTFVAIQAFRVKRQRGKFVDRRRRGTQNYVVISVTL